MALSAKVIRNQLNMLKPLLNGGSLKLQRKAQNKVGELMERKHRSRVRIQEHGFEGFQSAWVIPKDECRQGVILYLHGGGYTCGGLEYALGFGSFLADQTGTRVLCVGYRLAPEHPFPAALEDALEAYRYLLAKGYAANHITLCGESAGGGLCYSLCLELRRKQLPLPGGVIALSPWTDLTLSGPSYEENRDIDPSMSRQTLEFYAACYTDDPAQPLVSPLFGELEGLPPSLIFVGSDEIMGSDSQRLHEKLLAAGGKSRLVVGQDRWHAYLLYGLEEDRKDLEQIHKFLDQYMERANKLRWLRLDNAAKIYPAALRPTWSNVFRLSATLTEAVDRERLQMALDVTVRRFPSIAARLRQGVFWYYLQQLERAPELTGEKSYPLTRMTREELRKCAFRVLVYENRIAVEIFHSLTDGSGALIFLKSLVAEYLQQRYGIRIPAREGVLGRLEEPSEEELEDSFLKYAGQGRVSRRSNDAWHLTGTPEERGFLHVTCFRLSVEQIKQAARSHGVSVTAFLCAAMLLALQELQQEHVPNPRRQKSVKVQLPVNLRNLFPSKTLRNFAMYTTPELLPGLGSYTFEEICKVVYHCMGAEITPKFMSMMVATNVSSERLLVVRILPLFLKNLVMKAVFDAVGERKSCLSLSNLGMVRLPEAMEPYVQRLDFILGVQASAPYNCGVISYGDTMNLNFIRNIREPILEQRFYQVLRRLGISVQVQSNLPAKEEGS